MPSSRPSTESTFTASDGATLFYRAWLPAKPTSRALMLFHRGHEHSGRWQETVDGLNLDDVAVFAWDQRGHGRSPGERGSADGLATVIADAEAFSRHLVKTHGVKLEDTIVLAHSVGAVVATAWVHDYAPAVRGLVLATPAFRVRLYVPLAIPSLRLKQRFIGPGYVQSYVKSKMLTSDPEQARRYAADPQIFRQIAVNILLDLHDTSKRLLADACAITTPTLILTAGNDWVVDQKAQWTFFDRLSSPVKQIEVYPRAKHALFHDTTRAEVIHRTGRFIDQCFRRASDDSIQRSIDADKGGYTRSEYDRLRAPGSIKWKLMRGAINTVCQLSEGFRLGKRTGYDSGLTLDYVYADRPRGTSPLGRMIDKNYLNAIGWRGIRIRKRHLMHLLFDTAHTVHDSGLPVRILDIASGPGSYVIEAIAAMPELPATAVLRDYKQENIDAARRLVADCRSIESQVREELAEQLRRPTLPPRVIETLKGNVSPHAPISERVDFVLGDAFDRASIAATSPAPTIAIVSGLYELFPENEPVLRSLAGIADAVRPGGYLIYTCQPWHPQVEFIARTLTNREGHPWVMRRRTQREMDDLVRSAGFEKVEQLIDPWGIFTVSVARRVGVAQATTVEETISSEGPGRAA